MKRILLFFALTSILSAAYSQKSIDQLFEKYAAKDGFVTFTINGNILHFLNCLDDEKDNDSLPADITEIRILAQEDNDLNAVNFYDIVMKGIKLGQYEEFMRVNKTDQDLRMLVRAEGRKFREFLLIAGGEDNVIVQIKGNMTFEEAKRFSNDAKKNHGLNIVAEHK